MPTKALFTVMALLGAAFVPLSAQIGVSGGNNSGGTGQGPAGPAGPPGTAGSGYAATSTTSLTIGAGTAAFTTQSGLAYSAGARARASSAANSANYMEGLVTSYSGTSLAINVDAIGGFGTKNDWNINIAGNGASALHTVAFASAMVFTGTSTSFDLFKTTITGANTSATLTGNAGAMMELDILQDGAGHAFIAPTNIIPACPVSTAPNVTTVIKGSFDGTNLIQSGCTNNDVATFISGPERAPVTTTATGQGALTFDSSSHTLGYFANNSANRHIVPRCAGASDQCASSDLSDAGNIALLNASQTVSGNKTMTGSLDASGATHTLPAKSGIAANKPATCGVGEVYFATDATAGQNFFFCTAANTWVQQLNGGGGSTPLIGNSGTVAAIPATCTVGQLYFATNATAGQNIFECAALNTWTQQLNSGAGGASTALDNLSATNINQPLLPQSGNALGSAAKNWSDLFLNLSGAFGTGYVHFTGTPTAPRTIKVADANTATVQAVDCSSTLGQVIKKIDANGLPACTLTNGYPVMTPVTNTAVTFGTPVFVGLGGNGINTAENLRQTPMPSAGTLKNAFVNISAAQSAAGSSFCTWRKATPPGAAADTSVVVTIPASSPVGVYSDTTDSFTYAAGDLISIRCQQNTAGSSGSITGISNMMYPN
ncbi:MAG: hypothetical protein ABJC09_08295 [Terriglobia bacterium]